MKLDFKKKATYDDDYSKAQYAKYHCGFTGSKPFKTRFEVAECYADNLKKFLGDPQR